MASWSNKTYGAQTLKFKRKKKRLRCKTMSYDKVS